MYLYSNVQYLRVLNKTQNRLLGIKNTIARLWELPQGTIWWPLASPTLNCPIWMTFVSGKEVLSSKLPRTTCTFGAKVLNSSYCSFVERFPVQSTCCILLGTNILWNFSGMPAARCGMWKSPMTKTNSPKSLMTKVQLSLKAYSAIVNWLLPF